jgi:hypothetical protein
MLKPSAVHTTLRQQSRAATRPARLGMAACILFAAFALQVASPTAASAGVDFWVNPIAIAGAIATDLRASSPNEQVGKFMAAIAREKLARQFDVAWASLYPPHQLVATREAYVACETLIPWSGSVTAVRIVHVFSERISIAGAPRKLPTKAVSMRVTVVAASLPIPVVIEHTFHAIRVRDHWRWILSQEQYADYSAGTCPYA